MLYIVWIWWLFRSEEVAAILPLAIELCLACRPTAALLWYWMHFCCEAKAPQCLSTRCVLPSLLPCMCTCFQEELSQGQCLRCFAGLFHTPMYSLGRLIWPALPQLCCQVWVSCVWSWGRGRNSCTLGEGTAQENQPARPAAFLVLKVLPGSENTIQSLTGGVFFTGGWKQKGVKRRPRTPLCQRSGLSQSG